MSRSFDQVWPKGSPWAPNLPPVPPYTERFPPRRLGAVAPWMTHCPECKRRSRPAPEGKDA